MICMTGLRLGHIAIADLDNHVLRRRDLSKIT